MCKAQNNLQQRRNCTLITDSNYNGKSINTSKEKNQNCIEEILKPINAHLEDMREKHNKVMVTRFDLHTSKGMEDFTNKGVGRIFENMGRALKRKEYAGGHNPDPRFIGVAENNGHSTHFHCVAIVNGNAIQNPYTIFNEAERCLANALDIPQEEAQKLVNHCDKNGKNGIMIKNSSPNEEEQVNVVMHQASYLAKERSKEDTPKGQYLWIGTRVPKKDK